MHGKKRMTTYYVDDLRVTVESTSPAPASTPSKSFLGPTYQNLLSVALSTKIRTTFIDELIYDVIPGKYGIRDHSRG